jgi:DNA-binding NarL/FixJ family response regulator
LVREDQVSEDDNMPIDLQPSPPAKADAIFVIEGDEVVRSALHFILDDQDETHSFAALDPAFAKAAEVAPDVVLLGIGFVRNDAERVLAEIERRLPGAKIMIVANSTRDPLALDCLKWGAHSVLGKPITFDSVRCKVDALLGRHAISPALLGLLPLSAAW